MAEEGELAAPGAARTPAVNPGRAGSGLPAAAAMDAAAAANAAVNPGKLEGGTAPNGSLSKANGAAPAHGMVTRTEAADKQPGAQPLSRGGAAGLDRAGSTGQAGGTAGAPGALKAGPSTASSAGAQVQRPSFQQNGTAAARAAAGAAAAAAAAEGPPLLLPELPQPPAGLVLPPSEQQRLQDLVASEPGCGELLSLLSVQLRRQLTCRRFALFRTVCQQVQWGCVKGGGCCCCFGGAGWVGGRWGGRWGGGAARMQL